MELLKLFKKAWCLAMIIIIVESVNKYNNTYLGLVLIIICLVGYVRPSAERAAPTLVVPDVVCASATGLCSTRALSADCSTLADARRSISASNAASASDTDRDGAAAAAAAAARFFFVAVAVGTCCG